MPSRCCSSARCPCCVLYAMQRLQGILAVQSAEARRGCAGTPGLQYRRVLHHKHQLAGLFGRDHDELLHPDGGPGLSQLCVGGGRHRAGDCVHPRRRAASDADHRQLLGRHGAGMHFGCCCRSASSARCCWSRKAWCRTSGLTTRRSWSSRSRCRTTGPDGKPGRRSGKP